MSIRIKLSDIIDGIESQSDEYNSYLNKKTGEVVLVSDYEMRAAEEEEPIEDYPEWEQDQIRLAREIIAETGQYVPLSSKFDVDEHGMMESFCLSLADPKVRDALRDLIRGAGASRRFKDAVFHYGVEEQWRAYHDNALKEIAIAWCRQNHIEFDE
jgi:hypothetical protein